MASESEATSRSEGDGPKRRWATEDLEQPWTVGEAIGVAMRSLGRGFFSLTIWPFVVSILGVAAALVPVIVALGPWLVAVVGERLHPSASTSGGFGVEAPPMGAQIGAGVGAVAAVLVFSALAISFRVEAVLAAVRAEAIKPGRVGRALRRWPYIILWTLLPFIAMALPIAFFEGVPMLIARSRGITDFSPAWYVHLFAALSVLAIAWAFVVGYWWAPFFMVDDGPSLFPAMQKSWHRSKAHVVASFFYVFALAPIQLLTFVPVIGTIAQAFTWLGQGYGYVRATGRNELPWYPPEFGSRSIRTFLKITFGVLLVVAGVLVGLVKLPKATQVWSLADTFLHAGAIIACVAVVIVFLALLLPYGLDLLEGRRFTTFVAIRHVRSQKSGFLTVISVLSICGIAISSCALSSVRGVMDGFGDDLKRKILGNTAHIVIDRADAAPWENYEEVVEAVRKVPGVVTATPVVHGEVMASSASNLGGVVVTGIEPADISVDLKNNIKVGKIEYLEHPEKLTHLPANEIIGLGPNGEPYYKGAELPALDDDIDPAVRAAVISKPERPGIILGLELAQKTLHVYVGDEVTLVSPLGDLGPMGVMPRTKRFRVAAIFDSGMYEYDAMSVYMMLDHAQEYFATGHGISAIDIKVEDVENSDRLLPAVIAAVNRSDLRVRDWREINKNLFSALALERYATSIILSIAILVASFCIICTLLLMVTEKGKEIAILKAVGASDGAILRTFMIEGVIIGGIGMVFGVLTGLALCSGLSWIGLPLPSEVYYIHGLPVRVSVANFVAVAVAALLITTISTIYPAYAASRLRPVDGLRYE